MTKLYAALAALLGFIGIIAGAFFKGRSSGKKVEQEKQKDVFIETAKEVQDVENRIPTDDRDVVNKLRDEWSRD